MVLDPVGGRSLNLKMIWEQIIHILHFRLDFWQIRLGNNLSHLLLVDFAYIIQIIDIVTEVETIFDRVIGSAMEWAVF